MQDYWRRQISRRRAMAGVATLGAGALAAGLAGCGGDDEGGGGGAGLVTEPLDTTKQAVKGGVMQDDGATPLTSSGGGALPGRGRDMRPRSYLSSPQIRPSSFRPSYQFFPTR